MYLYKPVMKKYILLLSIVSLLFSSCATLEPGLFRSNSKNSVLLPTLDPQFDMRSLNAYYPEIISGGNYMNSNNVNIAYEAYPVQIKQNILSQDIINIFERDVKDNITDPFGDYKGAIVCKVVYANQKSKNIALTVLSTITLGIGNLLGLPTCSEEMAMDIEVEIYDLSDKLIGRYSSQGYDKEWVALYYGYDTSDAIRKANAIAFKNAMSNIKEQINQDADRLSEILNNQ